MSRKQFWLEQLRGFVGLTQIPIAKGSNLQRSIADTSQSLKLSLSSSNLLGCLAQQQAVEIETIITGAWALLLSRYSCAENVLFGTHIFCQQTEREDHPQPNLVSSDTILLMRVKVEPEQSLLPWLQELQSLRIELGNGDRHSLAQICQWSGIASPIDLCESLLVLEQVESEKEQRLLSEPIKYPLTLKIVAGQQLGLKLDYDPQRFEVAAIDRLLGHLHNLLEGMASNPHHSLADLSMLSESERHQLVVEWNDTRVDYPDKTIHQVFEEQVELTPDAIAAILPALDGGDTRLTYRELNDQSHKLAMFLQQMGVGTEVPVAMYLERSIETLVAILGILKAGGVYVPLDPASPQDRLALMLEDIQPPVLLTQSHLKDRLPPYPAQIVCLDADFDIQLPSVGGCSGSSNSSHLAYINFTSGSTGKPKGVAIPHRAVLRLIFGSQFTQLDRDRTLLQLAPISFDAATLEIWGALLHGGRCILFPGNGIPDPKVLGTIIQKYQVTTLWLTAALFNTIVAESPEVLVGVKELFTGGEALSPSHIRHAQAHLVGTQLINGYGPTESTTFTCCYRIPNPLSPELTSIPIGRPIANTQVYVLDDRSQPVPIGIPGELYIGGDGLASGYVNRPELTQERFVHHPFSDEPTARLYKTGDMVRYLPDGTIEFLGRKDEQVKIRGYRIELGEIESVLSQHETVRDAVVIVREDLPGHQRLVAYVTPNGNSPNLDLLSGYLSSQLAEYMIPTAIVVLDKLPLTVNGKVDRRSLPIPVNSHSEPNFVAASTVMEQNLADIWCGVLGLDRVGVEANFFDIGGTSLLGLQMVTRVQKQLDADFRGVKLYQYPTIRTLARFLDRIDSTHDRSIIQHGKSVRNRANLATTPATAPHNLVAPICDGVAIIGMVGRFPGANHIEELWQNLCAGADSNTFFTDLEIDPSIDQELRHDPNYVRARGIVEGAETFDAAFFGISPREAEVMDPQARVFLELAHQALETVGYDPDRYDGLIGLYAGSGQNTYFEKHISGRSEIINRLGEFQTMLANEKDFLTTRTSYKLGLTGPSLSINTACSTSLVAVIEAFQSLINHQCDMALAGGVSITTPQNRGYLYQEGSMLSPDGRCRPFDVNAQGTLFNSGAGIVVLKRLEDALEDGDRIYAVIKGVGMNNDGADKVSFTAPSVNGQAAAIAMAHANCGINPETITYIEAHGTATPLGDPIEIEALTLAFQLQTTARQFCAIGSIKGNIGHVVAAAGVAGIIKTALALDRQQIPPSLYFESPNPLINFADSPFFVNTQLKQWTTDRNPRRAGVSSFGVGGTNAHVVLEEAPVMTPSGPSRPCQLLLLSAKTATALEQATTNLHQYLTQSTESLADIAYTLQQGRKGFNYRRTIVCQDTAEAISALETLDVNRTATRHIELRNPEVVFMFPGQGSQYVNMGANLYQQETVFRTAVDRCADILMPLLGKDLRKILYPDPRHRESAADCLRQTQFTQPAIFTIEYALAQLWQSWGIYPAAAIGHSIGEFVAACLAGVFSLADGLKLVATRGRMMGEVPTGSMLSVRLPAAAVANRLTKEMSIAAINGPALCVVSGPTELVDSLQQQLEREQIICKPLHTSHAFHSPMMDSIIEPFAALVKNIQLSPPQIPFVSTVSATWITDEQATDYLYWANHLRATVRFAEGVQTLWQKPERVLLEIGPRTITATLARQQAKDLKRQIAISSLGSSADENAEWTSLIQAIGQLWRSGVEIDWAAFSADEYRQRIPLPTYPFDRQRYWIDPKPAPIDTPNLPPLPVETPAMPDDRAALPKISSVQHPVSAMTETRRNRLMPILQAALETNSGFDLSSADEVTTFLEMGLDSLSLTQVAIALKKQFKLKITFRNLLEDYPNLGTLADFLDENLPAEALPAPVAIAIDTTNRHQNGNGNVINPLPIMPSSTAIEGALVHHLQGVVRELARGVAQELALLGQTGVATAPTDTPVPSSKVLQTQPDTALAAPKKSSGPGAKIEKTVSTVLSGEQQTQLDKIIARYNDRTPESKRQTQEHRKYLADPRTVSGFTPLLKEMVYPIVTDRASGSKLWDVDGNEYIDITNGFGLNFFGWSPDFVTAAVKAQLDKGIEIGPQSPLAGKVAKLVAEFTGMERVAFCNTGSEAVMATFRLARTVTGRDLIATFAGDYHGTFDEVLYRQGAKLKTLPAAPGIMPSMFDNLLVLDYNDPASLQILRDRADDLAAILVEPVRSRDPDLQPHEFLQDLRRLTEQSGTALIFDEVVTGFRVHPGGAQAYFNIQADMATYGKIVGGGLPIGIVAGKAEYLDALDGGFWQYGDNSIPEVGVTFFAGTFVRHPMALAAAAAVLQKLKEGGPELQRSLADKVNKFATHLNQHFDRVKAPIKIAHFSSLFYVNYPHELPYANLLFYLMREKGVHVWDHRPCFFTLAHTDEEIEVIIRAFKDSVSELQAAEFLPSGASQSMQKSDSNSDGRIKLDSHSERLRQRNQPPKPGARLGRDPDGKPAWYGPDPNSPGKYLKIEEVV